MLDFQEHVFIKVPNIHLNLARGARQVVKDVQYCYKCMSLEVQNEKSS